MNSNIRLPCIGILILTIFTTNLHSQDANKNNHLVCSPYKTVPASTSLECDASKCTAICAANYKFPKGEGKLEIECVGSSWKIANVNYRNSKELPACQPTCSPACLNNGKCIAPNKCQCTADFMGAICKEKACRETPTTVRNARMTCRSTQCSMTCLQGFKFPNQATTMNLQCRNGNWISVSKNLKPNSHCEPFCYKKCLNNGKCIAPNKCQCPSNSRGAQCQYSTEKCSTKKTGFNGSFNCMSSENELNCTIDCPEGIKFDHPPAAVYSCKYSEGRFSPAKMPRCIYPVSGIPRILQRFDEPNSKPPRSHRCNPTCQNGGECVFHNTCNCPREFAGDQCQFSVERCSPPQTGFNGGFSCSGNMEEFTCVLTCPPGVEFEFPPAVSYKCKFATGIFTPPNIPKCVYGEGVQVFRKTVLDKTPNGNYTCNPSCQNDGKCVFTDLCQCTKMFRGPHCQYPVDNCSFKKTGFNGSYKCTATSKEMTCQINCPPDVALDGPVADAYVCQYDTGRYLPSPVPKCVYGDDVEIIQRTRTSD